MPIKEQVTQSFTGEWQIGLFETPCKAPVNFCLGCVCTCCMAGKQRGDILDITGEPYICCGGLCPCGPLGEPQDRNCMWLEACCCTGMAISGNRFLIQTRFDRRNTACDDCLLWSVCIASWCVCLSKMFCDDLIPEEVENCVDCLIMIVDGCMLGQQQREIEYIQKTGYNGPPQHVLSALTPKQQGFMMAGKPPVQQSMGAGAGMAMGGAVAGGAGAAVMGKMMGGQPQAAPMQQPMGQYGQARGFMATMSPRGIPWAQHCAGQQVMLTPDGMVGGAWGECIAWAKYFEYQNPNWENNPDFASGPCGQAIDAMAAACPNEGRAVPAAERLEKMCEQAADQGRPFPIINQRL